MVTLWSAPSRSLSSLRCGRLRLAPDTCSAPPARARGRAWFGVSRSRYRVLLKLPNKSERAFYIDLVQENGWSSRQLSAAIDSGLHKEGQKAKSRLARPGDQSFVFAATVVDVIDGDTVVNDLLLTEKHASLIG